METYDYGAPPPPPPKTSILAILSLVFAFCCQPVGFVLGIVAMILIGRSQGRVGGMGLAIAGTVVSGVMSFFCLPMIAAVAIPGLLHSRNAANETSAIGSLKAICTGQEQLRLETQMYGTLEVLGGTKPDASGKLHDANPFIPGVLGKVHTGGVSMKAGYCFKVYVRGPNSYVAYAWPAESRRTGVRFFAIDEGGQPFARSPSPFEGPGNPPPPDEIEKGDWKPVG
jgi:hypothetical protein